MAKKISSSDLFEQEDIFIGLRKSADQAIAKLEKLEMSLKDIARVTEPLIKNANFGSTQGINQFTEATKKAEKTSKDFISVEKQKQELIKARAIADQQLIKVQQEKERLEQQQIRTTTAKQQADAKANKEVEKGAKVARDEANAYKQLEKNTRDLKNQSKQLGAELLHLEQTGRKNTAEYRKLAAQYQQVTASAQRGDAQLKKLDKSVGDNFRNVGNYKSALGGLQNMLSKLGIAFGISTIVRSAFGAIKDFDQGVANLASVLGTTQDKIIALSEDAKRLGATTRFTAGEVAQLQTEFAKLGFNETEILNATESTLSLAGATGTDLARSAEVAGSTLRAFGLNASEMQRITDVMAKSFSTSALDMESFAESMKYVAPVSKAAGVSLEETTAMLGALADNGIKGSSAGTALRRIFSEMATTGKPVKEALAEISDRGLNLTDAMDEVGRSAQTALLVLSKSQEKVGNLTETYQNAECSAKSMADTQLKTLGGALDLLSSAWQGYILKINSASGAGAGFSNALVFLSENLESIFNILFKVTTAYVTYKGVLIALNVIERIRNTNFKDLGNQMMRQIPLTKQYAQAQKEMATNQQQGASATKGLGSALAGVGWTIAIGVAMELAKVMYDVASGAKAAREQQALLDQYNENAQKNADKRVTGRQKDLQKDIAELQRQRNENKLTEKEFLKLKEDAIKKTKEQITKDISLVRDRKKTYLDDLEFSKTYMKKAERDAKNRSGLNLMLTKQDTDRMKKITATYASQGTSVDHVIQKLNATISGAGVKITAYKEELDGTSEAVKDATSELKSNGVAQEDNTGKITAKIPKQKEINTEFKKYNEYLSRQTELLEQINQIEADRQINAIEKQIENEVELQTKKADETKEYDLTRFNELVNEKYQLQVDAILKQNDFEQEQNQLKYDRDKAQRQTQLDEEYQSLIDGANGNQQAINEINENYKLRKQQLADDELKIEKDLQTQNLIIQKNTTDEIDKLQQDKLDLIDDTNAQLLDKTKVEAKDEIDVLKKAEEEKRALIKMTSDFFIGQSEKRIAKIDEEINKATQQYEHLKGLAESGNIDARQSLAEQQKIIDDANLRKQRELKKQQRIKLAESVYSTYSQKVESGSKNPLAETIRDTTLLNQFINSLPAFESGTENTGANGRGVDGKGGFHAILHPNERVIPKSLNEQIGAMSNEDLARIAQEHQNNKNFGGNYQSGTSLELALLVNEIKDLKTIIKDKPETNIELGEITTGAMEIVKSVRQGNTTTYNRYKIK